MRGVVRQLCFRLGLGSVGCRSIVMEWSCKDRVELQSSIDFICQGTGAVGEKNSTMRWHVNNTDPVALLTF